MTIEAFKEKLERWGKEYPKAAKAYYRRKAQAIKATMQGAYSGGSIGVRTGALRRSLEYKVNRYGFLVSVKSRLARRHVSRMLEQGFKARGKTQVAGIPNWGPLRDKTEKELADEILTVIMESYRNG